MSAVAERAIVDWQSYAQKYDMLLDYNPFYQQLREEILAIIKQWQFSPGDLIADIGAGTGNYSIALAAQFPRTKILHIDSNPGMIGVVEQKKKNLQLDNIEARTVPVEELQLEPASLSACFCIHSLYTFPDPAVILKNIYSWMKPGAVGIFVDPGRPVKVLDWQLAIGWKMISTYGLRKTLQVMREGREISHQNRQISKLQAQGVYWNHSHEEFCTTVEAAGFEIKESRYCFRKISDLVVVEKK